MNNLNDKKNWTADWHGKIFCGNCGGIYDASNYLACTVCKYAHIIKKQIISRPGRKSMVVYEASIGAINWTTYSLLKLMQAEWERPINTVLINTNNLKTSSRAVIVILFWTLFESLIDQLLTTGMKNLPKKVADHLLKRHQQIGSRIDSLYPLIFDTTFKDDMTKIGYSHLVQFLKHVQESRNLFIHGNPENIDDELVQKTVNNLSDIQSSWIALYNLKCAKVV